MHGKLRSELLRAYGGALLVGLPLLMTQEMWQAGFTLPAGRLVLFLVLNLGLLFGLSYYIGFTASYGWARDSAEALIAFGVGLTSSAVILLLIGVLMPAREPVGVVLRQLPLLAVPSSIGAIIARSQFGGRPKDEEEKEERSGLGGHIFVGVAGAVFIAFNVAPTDEVMRIAMRVTGWQTILLALLSISVLYGFVFAANFRGGHRKVHSTLVTWTRFPLISYVASLLVSAYVLWTFGRLDLDALGPHGLLLSVNACIVLGLPAALGAAVGNLIL